jgi:hypothetical protein
MGKAITGQEYGKAKHAISACREPTCRNFTKQATDEPCPPCVKAYKVVKEYDRTHKGSAR